MACPHMAQINAFWAFMKVQRRQVWLVDESTSLTWLYGWLYWWVYGWVYWWVYDEWDNGVHESTSWLDQSSRIFEELLVPEESGEPTWALELIFFRRDERYQAAPLRKFYFLKIHEIAGLVSCPWVLALHTSWIYLLDRTLMYQLLSVRWEIFLMDSAIFLFIRIRNMTSLVDNTPCSTDVAQPWQTLCFTEVSGMNKLSNKCRINIEIVIYVKQLYKLEKLKKKKRVWQALR